MMRHVIKFNEPNRREMSRGFVLERGFIRHGNLLNHIHEIQPVQWDINDCGPLVAMRPAAVN